MTAAATSIPSHEWHRRGLRSPAEIAEIVNARLVHLTEPGSAEPTYADFLGEQVA